MSEVSGSEVSGSEANKRVALAFVEAMSAGDAAGMDRCVTPDVVTDTRGYGQVSGRRNRETMLATTGAFLEVMPTGLRPQVRKVVAEGEVVVVEFEGDAVLSNGVPYCNHYVFIFTFRDRLICKVDEYFCTVHADERILPLLAAKSEAMARGSG